jgi:hypothetical protein
MTFGLVEFVLAAPVSWAATELARPSVAHTKQMQSVEQQAEAWKQRSTGNKNFIIGDP